MTKMIDRTGDIPGVGHEDTKTPSGLAKMGISHLPTTAVCATFIRMRTSVLKNSKFSLVSKYVTMDSKKRVRLASAVGEAFNVYSNDIGQIILDPVEVVPASEAWLWKNKAALASVKRGLRQAEEGPGHDLGSFTRHAKE